MKLGSILALATLAACATSGGAGQPAEPARPRPDLVVVARSLTAIEAAERKGDASLERQHWSRAASQAPADPVARFLAVAAQPPGEDRWAAFKALSRELPESALPRLGMARTYVEWRILDQADREIAAALDREPDHWLTVLVRAQVAERRARLDAAAADYRTVLSADPENPEARLGLARIAGARGDGAAARAEATAALAAAPELFEAHALLGAAAEAAGDLGAAVGHWESAVESAPRDRGARATLARLYERQGDLLGARDQWLVAVQLQETPDALGALAAAARGANDPATEAAALERLTAVDASGAEWTRIAELRLAAQDLAGAEKALRRALAQAPRDPAANLGLARVHLSRGESQEAVEALRAAGPPGGAELAALEARLNLERLSRPDVVQLQKAVQALVDRTFRARQVENASLSGNLRLRVTVDGAGAASHVEVLEDSVHDPDVRACAYWNLRDATYPQGKPGRFSFGFSFRR